MAQKYRIYINEKVILLTTTLPRQTDGYHQLDNQLLDLKNIYTQVLHHQSNRHFFILCDDCKAALKALAKSVIVVKAAGGLVKNTDKHHLFIYRNDKWDLPKGKLEEGEKKKEGAVREVEEECGIKINKAGKKILTTYHMYTLKNEVILKKTYWYDMNYKGQQQLKPQTEEGITEVRWADKDQIKELVTNTYPSIIEVLQKKKLLKDTAKPL